MRTGFDERLDGLQHLTEAIVVALEQPRKLLRCPFEPSLVVTTGTEYVTQMGRQKLVHRNLSMHCEQEGKVTTPIGQSPDLLSGDSLDAVMQWWRARGQQKEQAAAPFVSNRDRHEERTENETKFWVCLVQSPILDFSRTASNDSSARVDRRRFGISYDTIDRLDIRSSDTHERAQFGKPIQLIALD